MKVVLIEFNELIPSLLERWIGEGKLPNFKRFHDESQVFVGTADVPGEPRLSHWLQPWVQWYSLHTGLGFQQHRVVNLTDGPKAGHADIWHQLLAHGYNVGNCASMNARGFAAPGSFFLPDPWCNTESPYPAELSAYQQVILNHVQENSNSATALGKPDYLSFLKFLVTHGLSTHSIAALFHQLSTEMRSRNCRWRRPVLLDKLQFDLFKHYWVRFQPDFCSFFTNSTAHFQHSFFHLLESEKFDLRSEMMQDEQRRDAILYGYQEMDQMLAEFFRLEQRYDLLLILATALSQEADPTGGRAYYRPRDMQRLMQEMNVSCSLLLPVMAHQYSAEFPDQASADKARAALSGIRLHGTPVFSFGIAPDRKLFFDCGISDHVPQEASITIGTANASVRFYDLFYRLPTTKTGAHHPDSVLWFKTGSHRRHTEKLSILDVFPTLADYFGVPLPTEDGLARQGTSARELIGLPRYRLPKRAAA